MLVNPLTNPVRDQRFKAQIEHHHIPIKKRQLQRKLMDHSNHGQRYKQAYVQKTLSKKNEKERTQYGQEHKDKSIEDFWSFIMFSDEAHVDPSKQLQGYELREQGTRYEAKNIQERGEKTGTKVHMAAWVNWFEKAPKLEFYNDEHDFIVKPKRPPRPRKSKYESEDAYNQRLLEWDVSLPHEAEVKPKDNSMTQKYYCERLLPGYIKAMHHLRTRYEDQPGINWLFQEDGDPSHGMRAPGLARRLENSNWVMNLTHPAQSPDLNPMEAAWNILKQRYRRRTWRSIEELKEVLQDKWSKIAMEEVRARISDIPRRCKLLVETGGKSIKSAQW